MATAEATCVGHVTLTIVRGAGVNHKIVYDDRQPNAIAQGTKDCIMQAVVNGVSSTHPAKVFPNVIFTPDQGGSGGSPSGMNFTVGTGRTTITDNKIEWKSHPEDSGNWEVVTHLMAHGSTFHFYLYDVLSSSTNPAATTFSTFEHTVNGAIQEGDRFRVVWDMTIGGSIYPAAQNVAALGLSGVYTAPADQGGQTDPTTRTAFPAGTPFINDTTALGECTFEYPSTVSNVTFQWDPTLVYGYISRGAPWNFSTNQPAGIYGDGAWNTVPGTNSRVNCKFTVDVS